MDDGGSDKSDYRLKRRKCQSLLQLLTLITGVIVIVFLCCGRPLYKGDVHSVRDTSIAGLQKLRSKLIHRQIQQKGGGLDNKPAVGDFFTMNKKKREVNADYGKDDDKDDDATTSRHKSKYRWVNKEVLPPINEHDLQTFYKKLFKQMKKNKREGFAKNGHEHISRNAEYNDWYHYDEEGELHGITLDYTKHSYEYPTPIMDPPRGGAYPFLEPLGTLLKRWPQDEVDTPPTPFIEQLQHFDYQNPSHIEAAIKYRELEFPFKMVNVPEISAATERWTDDYLNAQFDSGRSGGRRHGDDDNDDNNRKKQKHTKKKLLGKNAPSEGHCQQSVDNFFAFFNPKNWYQDLFGPPPTINNDFTYAKWAKHARYADATQLASNEEHFYWQSGVSREERLMSRSRWTFVSNDLPSFSSPEPTFFGFNPKEQKGIQCRFGERGVTAATHYDGGRNMVAMITGAKRYILSPPKECGKLGIITERGHPTYRHSLLNFGYINLLDGPEAENIPKNEREWLELSKTSLAIETVLKAGEVLYIPSHWFHYITSLQKSAQCNTRSGQYKEGSPEFGGYEDVDECKV